MWQEKTQLWAEAEVTSKQMDHQFSGGCGPVPKPLRGLISGLAQRPRFLSEKVAGTNSFWTKPGNLGLPGSVSSRRKLKTHVLPGVSTLEASAAGPASRQLSPGFSYIVEFNKNIHRLKRKKRIKKYKAKYF